MLLLKKNKKLVNKNFYSYFCQKQSDKRNEKQTVFTALGHSGMRKCPGPKHLYSSLDAETRSLLWRFHNRPTKQRFQEKILEFPARVARHHTLRLRRQRTAVERHPEAGRAAEE